MSESPDEDVDAPKVIPAATIRGNLKAARLFGRFLEDIGETTPMLELDIVKLDQLLARFWFAGRHLT